MSKMKKQGGFTLIEMLVVVGIIAALAALTIPMLSGVRDKAANAADTGNIGDLSRQLMTFAELNGDVFPDTLDSLFDNDTVGGSDPVFYSNLYAFFGAGHAGYGPMLEAYNIQSSMNRFRIYHQLANLGIKSVCDHSEDETFPNESAQKENVRDLDYTWFGHPGVVSYIAVLNITDDDNDGVFNNPYVQDIYDHFNIAPDNDSVAPNETQRIAVFGVGKNCTMVGNPNGGVQDCPFSTSLDTNETYTRYLALFLLPGEGTSSSDTGVGGYSKEAKFLGVLSPIGKTLSEHYQEYADRE